MDSVKLCKDCKHFIPQFDRCRKSPCPPDLVYGNTARGDYFHAQAERQTINGCGPEARWFESRAEAFAKQAGLA